MEGGHQILGVIAAICRSKGVDREIAYSAIESAIAYACRFQFPHARSLDVSIDRETGEIVALCDNSKIDPDILFARQAVLDVAMRTAGQIISEAEQHATAARYRARIGAMIFGESRKLVDGEVSVSIVGATGILPIDQQIPGDQRTGPLATTIIGAKLLNGRVEVQLSRVRDCIVRELFAHYVPEIAAGRFRVESVAREPGYRIKVGISCVDEPGASCLDACLGEQGERLEAICEELAGEKIDLIDWSAEPEKNIASALRPVPVERVILYPFPGRAAAIVATQDADKVGGRRGRNLVLASKLCGWDILPLTEDQYRETCLKATRDFEAIGLESAGMLAANGYFTYADLSVIEPDNLMRFCRIDATEAERIIARAEELADF